MREEFIGLRISTEERKQIKAYCAAHSWESESEFIRKAIRERLGAAVRESELILDSLKQLHDKLNRLDETNRDEHSAIFEYQQFETKRNIAHQPEIPDEMRDAAATGATTRFKRFFEVFKKEWARNKNSSAFESLLADFFEKQ